MRVIFDDQNVKDSLHVATAARRNSGQVEGSRPQDSSVTIRMDSVRGIVATGEIDGITCTFNEQQVIDAVALYLDAYHSFPTDRMQIEVSYDSASNSFSADVVV